MQKRGHTDKNTLDLGSSDISEILIGTGTSLKTKGNPFCIRNIFSANVFKRQCEMLNTGVEIFRL